LTGASTANNPHANYRWRYKYALLIDTKCPTGVTIKAVAVDELVSLAVLEVLKETQNIRTAEKRISQTHAEAVQERKKLEDEFRDAQLVHQQLRELMLKGVFNYRDGDKDFERDFGKATARLLKATEALDSIEEIPETPPNLAPWTTAKNIEQKWNRASTAEKNKVLRALVEKVVVNPPSGKWTGRGLDPDRVEIIWRIEASDTPLTSPKPKGKSKKKQRS